METMDTLEENSQEFMTEESQDFQESQDFPSTLDGLDLSESEDDAPPESASKAFGDGDFLTGLSGTGLSEVSDNDE